MVLKEWMTSKNMITLLEKFKNAFDRMHMIFKFMKLRVLHSYINIYTLFQYNQITTQCPSFRIKVEFN